MKLQDLRETIRQDGLTDKIRQLICQDDTSKEKQRYLDILDKAYELYGDGDYHLISASGRSEIGGNHTDHQHGKVIAASVNIDTLIAAKKNTSHIIQLQSAGFDIKPVDLHDLDIHPEEADTSESLIRGIASRFRQLGYEIGGFDSFSQSNVLVGSGISSSASFEVAVAQVFNHLYNDGKVNDIEIAKICQYAENQYFMKPSGLLDQMAISCGGFTLMNFEDINQPIVEKCEFDFKKYGYQVVLVNVKSSHDDLSHEYAAIPMEMKEVAHVLGIEYLGEISSEQFYRQLPEVYKKVKNKRAILRAIHFYEENDRVARQTEAIRNQDIHQLLELMRESGSSSYMYLQNIYCASNPSKQPLALALAMSEHILGKKGAYRVHGGGFAGTILAIVPVELLDTYLSQMHSIYGDDSTYIMNVRQIGGCMII